MIFHIVCDDTFMIIYIVCDGNFRKSDNENLYEYCNRPLGRNRFVLYLN